jgi:histidinol-phosphatase (PHP family)
MIAGAAAHGLEEVGISDHYVRPPGSPRDPCAWSMPVDGLGRYVAEVEAARARAGGIRVLLGDEADFFPETWPDTVRELSRYPFDYVIGSVHYAEGFPVDESAAHWERLSESEANEVWRVYWGLVRRLAVAGGFDILGHADLPKKFGFRPTADLSGAVAAALDALAASGVALELNTSGFDKPCAEAYPSPAILRAARARGIPALVTADAHAPNEISRHYDRAATIAREAGYRRFLRFRNRAPVAEDTLREESC